jgi:hypothetical protein
MPSVVVPEVPNDEESLLDEAIATFEAVLPEGWRMVRQQINSATGRDDGVSLQAPGQSFITFLPEVRLTTSPRDIQRLAADALSQRIRAYSSVNLLFIAPWISPRSRELLTQAGWSYLDLTGNIRIAAPNAALFILTNGAQNDPAPRRRGSVQLRGTRSARLIRFLCDVRPPYGVRELAGATGLNAGWVSQLLGALDAQALIDRNRRGEVTGTDPKALINRWAESYDVLKTNKARSYIAPNGARRALEALGEQVNVPRWSLTGSFAAVALAPVAAPSLLLVYTDEVDQLARALDLLPAAQGADVALLRPYDEAVWQRPLVGARVPTVGPSQLAVDCLTGTGRMPAEGEAVLDWMQDNEDTWRVPSLADLQ